MFLVDRRTRLLKAMRAIGLPDEAERKIKDTLREQLARFRDRFEFNSALNRIYQRFSTDDLIRRAELVCEFGGDR